jgi:hypothetical protein
MLLNGCIDIATKEALNKSPTSPFARYLKIRKTIHQRLSLPGWPSLE